MSRRARAVITTGVYRLSSWCRRWTTKTTRKSGQAVYAAAELTFVSGSLGLRSRLERSLAGAVTWSSSSARALRRCAT